MFILIKGDFDFLKLFVKRISVKQINLNKLSFVLFRGFYLYI